MYINIAAIKIGASTVSTQVWYERGTIPAPGKSREDDILDEALAVLSKWKSNDFTYRDDKKVTVYDHMSPCVISWEDEVKVQGKRVKVLHNINMTMTQVPDTFFRSK